MLKFTALFFTALFAAPTFAASIQATPNLICTRDLNPWGRASLCQCPSETYYDQRIGSCLKDDTSYATVEGLADVEVNSTGQVIGYTVKNDQNEIVRIVLPVALRSTFEAEDFQGSKVRISGELVERHDGSIVIQPFLILDTFEKVEEI